MESTEPGRYYAKFGRNARCECKNGTQIIIKHVKITSNLRGPNDQYVYYENGGQNLNPTKIWVRKIELWSKRRVKNIETVLNRGGG